MNRPPRSLIGDSLSFAYDALVGNAGAWTVMWLTALGFAVVGCIILAIIMPFETFMGCIDPHVCFSVIYGNTISGASSLFMLLASVSITLGFVRAVLDFYNTKVVNFRPLFDVLQILYFIAANVILVVLVAGGLIFFIIPGVLIFVRTIFTTYFIVDKNMGPFDAINASWELTRGKSIEMLGFKIVLLLINLVPIVGWLMTSLMTVYVYEELSQGDRGIEVGR